MDLKTTRLYYEDSYQIEFTARVVDRSPDGLTLYLDRTAFYPESGGQPCDRGWINDVPVVAVEEEGELVAHRLERPLSEDEVHCRVDWARRFDHMQQHSGQHLLSAVLLALYGVETVGFHVGSEVSTIDLRAQSLSPEQIVRAEEQANELVFRNLPVHVHWEEPGSSAGLRRPVERGGLLRVVTIEGIDRAACGGTHVRATGEIGPILIRKVDRAHGGVRLEFVCGKRALRRARADYEILAEVARRLSAPLQEVPRLVAEQAAALERAEKTRRKLALELADRQGRELYEACAPDESGIRYGIQRLPPGGISEEVRALAQSFVRQPGAVFLAACEQPPVLLLAASADSGWDAGALLKDIVTKEGGRGGGSARLAQGSLPDLEALERALGRLVERVPGLAWGLARR